MSTIFSMLLIGDLRACSQENFENYIPEAESGSSFDEKYELMVGG